MKYFEQNPIDLVRRAHWQTRRNIVTAFLAGEPVKEIALAWIDGVETSTELENCIEAIEQMIRKALRKAGYP